MYGQNCSEIGHVTQVLMMSRVCHHHQTWGRFICKYMGNREPWWMFDINMGTSGTETLVDSRGELLCRHRIGTSQIKFGSTDALASFLFDKWLTIPDPSLSICKRSVSAGDFLPFIAGWWTGRQKVNTSVSKCVKAWGPKKSQHHCSPWPNDAAWCWKELGFPGASAHRQVIGLMTTTASKSCFICHWEMNHLVLEVAPVFPLMVWFDVMKNVRWLFCYPFFVGCSTPNDFWSSWVGQDEMQTDVGIKTAQIEVWAEMPSFFFFLWFPMFPRWAKKLFENPSNKMTRGSLNVVFVAMIVGAAWMHLMGRPGRWLGEKSSLLGVQLGDAAGGSNQLSVSSM